MAGGRSHAEGRVEVYLPDRWGSVCAGGWGRAEATVACRQLGHQATLLQGPWLAGGPARPPAILAGAHCRGTEGRLADCCNASWDASECPGGDGHAAGVLCSDVPLPGNGSTAVSIGKPSLWSGPTDVIV